MKTTRDLFVPFKIAQQLKEKGFNEECFGYWEIFDCSWNNYTSWGGIDIIEEFENERLILTLNELRAYYNNLIKAPIYQQVIDWLDLHGIALMHYFNTNMMEWQYIIVIKQTKSLSDSYDDIYKAIEEALKLI